MKTKPMNDEIRYIAEPKQVREVSLLGTADLAYWRERFECGRLLPVEREGRAQILIISAEMRFMGLRFSEISFSVLVSDRGNPGPTDGAFLIHAFNSRRVFAFCERVLFSTPYTHGDVKVCTRASVSVQLLTKAHGSLRVEMGEASFGAPRPPIRIGEDGWAGRVFDPRCYFFAKTTGRTCVYAFDSRLDTLCLAPLPQASPLLPLQDSNFQVNAWIIREDATHGKSKTFRLPQEQDTPDMDRKE